MQLSWKIEFLICESLDTTSNVTDGQEKWLISLNKINSWNRVVLLCIDGVFSMLSVVGIETLVN